MSISGEGRSFPCSKETGASQPFPLNPTGTLSRRHLAQFVITKYRDKVQEVALRERIRTIIRQVCKELGVQIVSGILSREHVHRHGWGHMSIAFATRPEVNALASLSCWRRELACILAINAKN